VEEYRTEEEQVEALRRWWNENGRSIVTAIVIALAAAFGWQAWQTHQEQTQEHASNTYQALLRALGAPGSATDSPLDGELVEQLKGEYSGTTYAQFAALHMAAKLVNEGKLQEAEAQLRWVLGKAAVGSDVAQIAQLRLARVLAAAGETDQALAILDDSDAGPYAASYAAAMGDVQFAAGNTSAARDAYIQALALLGGADTGLTPASLQQKIQSLSVMTGVAAGASVNQAPGAETDTPATTDAVGTAEE
jgi:predicted negative regulator of RcsB-dependent stress response